MNVDDEPVPYKAADIQVFTLPEAARRRPYPWFGVEADDPSLMTAIVRPICLDPVPALGSDEQVAIRLSILDDTSLELTATQVLGTPAGSGHIDRGTGLHGRYTGIAAALGFAAKWSAHVSDQEFRIEFTFDPNALPGGSRLPDDRRAYTDTTGLGPWFQDGAVVIDDRRA